MRIYHDPPPLFKEYAHHDEPYLINADDEKFGWKYDEEAISACRIDANLR